MTLRTRIGTTTLKFFPNRFSSHSMNNSHLIGLLISVSLLAFLCILLSRNLSSDFYSFNAYASQRSLFDSKTNLTNAKNFPKSSSLANGCELPVLDPWDEAIKVYIYPEHKQYSNCTVIQQSVETVLSKGILKIVQHNVNATRYCAFRCLTNRTELNYDSALWVNVEVKK